MSSPKNANTTSGVYQAFAVIAALCLGFGCGKREEAPAPTAKEAAARPPQASRSAAQSVGKAAAGAAGSRARRTSASPTPKALGQVTVTATGAQVVTGEPSRRVATVAKGARLPYFSKAKGWYSVQVTTAQGPKNGWIHSRYVTEASTAPQAVSRWVVVTSDQASVRQQKGGRWVAAATLKKGTKVPVAKTERGYHRVVATVGGKPVTGWLDVKVTKPSSAPQAAVRWGTVTSDQARLRDQKGGKWVTAATLKEGTKVRVIGTKRDYHKVEATVGGRPVTGWLEVKAVKLGAAPRAARWGTVAPDQARVQEQKGGKWVTAATLKRGTRVRVISTGRGYHKIEANVGGKQITGWLPVKSVR